MWKSEDSKAIVFFSLKCGCLERPHQLINVARKAGRKKKNLAILSINNNVKNRWTKKKASMCCVVRNRSYSIFLVRVRPERVKVQKVTRRCGERIPKQEGQRIAMLWCKGNEIPEHRENLVLFFNCDHRTVDHVRMRGTVVYLTPFTLIT